MSLINGDSVRRRTSCAPHLCPVKIRANTVAGFTQWKGCTLNGNLLNSALAAGVKAVPSNKAPQSFAGRFDLLVLVSRVVGSNEGAGRYQAFLLWEGKPGPRNGVEPPSAWVCRHRIPPALPRH
jgi:hypothetical protein